MTTVGSYVANPFFLSLLNTFARPHDTSPPLNIERASGIPAKNIITQLERKKEILIDSFIHFFIDILPVSLFLYLFAFLFFNLLRHCHVYNFLEINCHQKMVIIYVFLVCWFLLAAHYSILCFSCWTQHTAGPNKNQDRSTHTHTIFSGVVTQGTGRLGKKLFLARPLAHI